MSDSQRILEIRAKLRSVDVERSSSDDLEYASDLDFLLSKADKLVEALQEAKALNSSPWVDEVLSKAIADWERK